MSTTTNLEYLQRNLLDDGSATIWGTAELYDAMDVETESYVSILSGISTTHWDSGKTFWVPSGTGLGQAPYEAIVLNGTVLGTAAYTLSRLTGRVELATAATPGSDILAATFYACNLWEVAAGALMRRLNSTTVISGTDKTIRLGPLSKSVRDMGGAVTSHVQKVNAFKEWARRWRSVGCNPTRVRL